MLTDVDVRAGLDGDHLAVNLEDNVIDLLAARTVSSRGPWAEDAMGRVRTWGKRRRTSHRRRGCRSTTTWRAVGAGGEHGEDGGAKGGTGRRRPEQEAGAVDFSLKNPLIAMQFSQASIDLLSGSHVYGQTGIAVLELFVISHGHALTCSDSE